MVTPHHRGPPWLPVFTCPQPVIRGSLLLPMDPLPGTQGCFQGFSSSRPFQQYPKVLLYFRAVACLE